MNEYRTLIKSYAATLVIYGKEPGQECFDALDESEQAELRKAYIANMSEEDREEMMASVAETLGINPGYLIATGSLFAQDVLKIRDEFNDLVAYYIENDLHESYIEALENKDMHVAEYKADYWKAA